MSIKIGNMELGRMPVVVGVVSSKLDLPPSQLLPVDIFEVRADMLCKDDYSIVPGFIEDLMRRYSKPVLLTVRSVKEGGASQIEDSRRLEIIRSCIPMVDAVDMELASADIFGDVLALCRENSLPLMGSYHNFNETPGDASLEGILASGAGADIVKIAVTARERDDLGRFAAFTVRNTHAGTGPGLVTISIGDKGFASRVFFPLLGSLLTYGYVGAPSAPGQVSAVELSSLIGAVDHEYAGALKSRKP